MVIQRRGRIRKLFPVAGADLSHGYLTDMSSGKSFAIEVNKGEFKPNEVVEYTPGRIRTKAKLRWPNLDIATVRKLHY